MKYGLSYHTFAHCARGEAIQKEFLIVRFIVLFALYTMVTKQKEVTTMTTHKTKKTNLYIYRNYQPPCPNAADPGYFLDKLVDGILSVVTGLGAITFLFFLVTL